MPSIRFTRKRGRPRSSLKPEIDRGTPELMRKHAAGLTADPLDALHAAGWLKDAELRNALLFRRLYVIRYGCPQPQALDMSDAATGGGITRDRSREEQEFRFIAENLAANGLLAPLIQLVIFGNAQIKHAESMAKARKALMEMEKLRKRFSCLKS